MLKLTPLHPMQAIRLFQFKKPPQAILNTCSSYHISQSNYNHINMLKTTE